MSPVATIARLTWKRILRGRTIWATAILLLVPLGIAALTFLRLEDPGERWSMVAEITLRSIVLLAPVLFLSPVVNEENENKTYTYLWSRPVPRTALLFGKLLAVAPVVAGAAVVALIASFGIVSLGQGEMDPSSLPRVLLAAAAGTVAASCFALGIGTLFPRHPLVAAFGYVFFAEQILPQVKAIQNVSTLYHVKIIAHLPRSNFAFEGGMGGALLALALLSALWLGLAVWRIRRLELGSADG